MLPESSVLIAVMNHARDLKRARTSTGIAFPVRSAPKFFPPDYVAFYFTKPFSADAFSVRWYAKVRGHELVTRRDLLPENPLIAVMNHARDLERARDEHWYRIPVRSAPKFFPPDYVAFYFTKPFSADAFSVRWYAQVRGHELVTRRDLLPDEPDHPRADQRYYKLQLGKLVELPHPIPSRSLRRITFILTNGKRLNEAWEINDLFLGPREQDILWRALKEARLQAERNYVIREAKSTVVSVWILR